MIIVLSYDATLNSFILDKDLSVGIPDDVKVKSRSINASTPSSIMIDVPYEVAVIAQLKEDKGNLTSDLAEALSKVKRLEEKIQKHEAGVQAAKEVAKEPHQTTQKGNKK